MTVIDKAKMSENTVDLLREIFQDAGLSFPFDVVVADECQGYIGQTDGYSLLTVG
jgi:hypothetical protein